MKKLATENRIIWNTFSPKDVDDINHFVYSLVGMNKVFYIGITKDPGSRLVNHDNDTTNIEKFKRIRFLKINGEQCKMEIHYKGSYDEMLKIEQFLINSSPDLLNLKRKQYKIKVPECIDKVYIYLNEDKKVTRKLLKPMGFADKILEHCDIEDKDERIKFYNSQFSKPHKDKEAVISAIKFLNS